MKRRLYTDINTEKMIPNIKDFCEGILADGDDSLVVASIMAYQFKVPMIWKRSSVKKYGKKKIYECGDIKDFKGKKIIVIKLNENKH